MSGRSHITVKSIGIGSRPRVSMCTQRNVAVGRGRWGNVGPAFPREHVVSGTDSSYQCVTTPLFELTLSRYCIFIFMYLCIDIILSEREKDLHSIWSWNGPHYPDWRRNSTISSYLGLWITHRGESLFGWTSSSHSSTLIVMALQTLMEFDIVINRNS